MKRIWTLIGRTLTMNNEQIEAFVEVLVPIIEERINKGNYRLITYYRQLPVVLI